MPSDSLSQIMDRFREDLERYIAEEVKRQISSQQKSVSSEPMLSIEPTPAEKPLPSSPASQPPESPAPVVSPPSPVTQNAAWDILKRLKEKKKR